MSKLQPVLEHLEMIKSLEVKYYEEYKTDKPRKATLYESYKNLE